MAALSIFHDPAVESTFNPLGDVCDSKASSMEISTYRKMEENSELKKVKSMLRSVLMSCKEGVPATILQRDYKEVVGEFLPFKKLGYSNLEDFILSIPDVVRVSKKGNEYIFNAVADESTAHIQKLVSKQRSKKVKKPVRRPRGGGRGGSSFMPRQPGLLTPRPPVYTPYVPHIPGRGRRGARNGMPSFMPQLVKALSPMMVHLNSGRGRMITIGNRSAPSNESFGEKPQSKFEMPPRFRHQKQPSGPQTKKPANDLQHVEDVEQYLQQLLSYLIDANLTAKFETTPAQGGFASSMVLNKRVYGSEGIFETAKEAEAAVARNILNSREIKDQGYRMPIIDWDNPTPPISDWAEEVCKGDSSTDLSQRETIKIKTRMKEILTNKKNGLWATRIAFEYKEKYNEEPPSDLVNLLKKWTDICKVELAPNTNMEIVYPVDESSGSKDAKIPKVDLLQSGVEAVVYVTYINNPGYFCIQKEDSIIEEISAKLEKHCKTANRPSQLEKGQFCAGVYSGDGHWFRAQVLDVNSQGKAQLLFVDFGNVEWVTIDAVRWLSPQLAEYPAQSVNCSLAGIIPLQNETEWSVEATKLMAKAVEEEALVAIPKCFYDNLVDVELFLKKNRTTSLNAFLVKKGVVRTIPTDVVDKPQPDILVLPEDNNWDVHVTYISSSLESVMVRIVGEEYSDRLEKFMGTLETAFKESHSKAPIIEGVTYVAYDDGLYHRVRVISQDEEKVECYFLDHGDTDNLQPKQLQPLDPKIDCQLSYQAMEVCMFGLESVYTNITALEKMVDLAMGKTCVAEVIDRDIPSVILYDTSGDSDININETILRTVKEEGGGIDSPRTSSPAPNSTSNSASSTSSTPRVLSPVPGGLARENDLNSNNQQQTGVGLSAVASMENLSTVPQQNNTDTQCNGNTNKLLNYNNQMKSETLQSSYMPPPPPPKINQTISSEKLTSNNNKAETSLTYSIQSLSLAAGSPQAACGEKFSIGEAQSQEPTCILKTYPVPNVGEYLDVHVICVNDPHSFMCIPYDEMNKFEGLLRKMLEFYTKNVELLHEKDIILGETYAGHKDGMWLRVKVTQQVSPGLYCAYQVDIGEFSVMELSELRPLDSAFCQLPIMAFQAKLGSLLPVEQRWSEASKYKLIQLALNKDLVGLVRGHNAETGVTDLKLIDTSNENYDICIDEVLIRLEYAKKASD